MLTDHLFKTIPKQFSNYCFVVIEFQYFTHLLVMLLNELVVESIQEQQIVKVMLVAPLKEKKMIINSFKKEMKRRLFYQLSPLYIFFNTTTPLSVPAFPLPLTLCR
jgi:hypothetical protein